MNFQHRNVTLSGSDDYTMGIATPFVHKFKGNAKKKRCFYKHCIVGTGSVVLPDITFTKEHA
jgi:hypothetical protein